MLRMRPLILGIMVSLLLFLPICAIQGSTAEPDPLPAIFAPFKWVMDMKQLNNVFPKAEIRESEYMAKVLGRMRKTKAITVSSGTWRAFGPAYVRVHHDDYKSLTAIFIETEETRPECNLDTERSVPKYCRTQYNAELLGVLNRVMQEMSKTYGKPEGPFQFEDTSDSRERYYRWKRKGFDLTLNISKDEQDDWAVALVAMRNCM